MKTEAIGAIFGWIEANAADKGYELYGPYLEARKELEALETALAVKDEALQKAAERFDYLLLGGIEECNGISPRVGSQDCRSALSPQTDKVLVDIEKLREIGHSGDMFCPSCGGGYPLHDADCWLGIELAKHPRD